jgi:hypothetical protein
MTEAEREELIEKMAKVMWENDGPENRKKSRETGRIIYLREARAALAVAEPVIREQCAEIAAAIAKEHLTDAVARIVAAAIREGGKDGI